jgi:hypothetical protein
VRITLTSFSKERSITGGKREREGKKGEGKKRGWRQEESDNTRFPFKMGGFI